jgi:hypothetical protein
MSVGAETVATMGSPVEDESNTFPAEEKLPVEPISTGVSEPTWAKTAMGSSPHTRSNTGLFILKLFIIVPCFIVPNRLPAS